jgi:hypothetical protein
MSNPHLLARGAPRHPVFSLLTPVTRVRPPPANSWCPTSPSFFTFNPRWPVLDPHLLARVSPRNYPSSFAFDPRWSMLNPHLLARVAPCNPSSFAFNPRWPVLGPHLLTIGAPRHPSFSLLTPGDPGQTSHLLALGDRHHPSSFASCWETGRGCPGSTASSRQNLQKIHQYCTEVPIKKFDFFLFPKDSF